MVNDQMVNNLMTCRYCLLFELGHCRKTNPYPADKEPRYLRLRTGQLLTLRFDCRRCEMTINPSTKRRRHIKGVFDA